LGGWRNTNRYLNEVYDVATNSWATKARVPLARSSLIAATVGGKIYAIGGSNGSYVARNEAYDPAADSWATKTDMPTVRRDMGLGSAIVGGKIFAVGGYNGSRLAINEEYDAAVDVWTTRAPMRTARWLLAAAAAGGRIYLVGGYTTSNRFENEEYDPGIASSFTALTPNTLYSFKAKVRSSDGTESAESSTVSTYTLAAVGAPLSGTALFTEVYVTSATVNWSSGTVASGFNGPGATYLVQASSQADFSTITNSSSTANIFAAVPELTAETTYYFRVRAYNTVGVTDYSFLILGATQTLAAVAKPTNIVFDEISTTAITASAYIANMGDLSVGQIGRAHV
jgi:hypothetical protein